MDKPKLAILMCGQARTFPGGWGECSNEIKKTYDQFFGKLSEKYTLYFYVSTDDVHIQNTRDILNSYGTLRDMYLSDTKYREVNKSLEVIPEEGYMARYESYQRVIESNGFFLYHHSIPQFYRNYTVYRLFEQDSDIFSTTNIVFRIRLDTTLPRTLTDNVIRYLEYAIDNDNDNDSTLFASDLFYCGTKRIMQYLMKGLDNDIGGLSWQEPYSSKAYTSIIKLCDETGKCHLPDGKKRWELSPEGQLGALFHKFLIENGESKCHNFPLEPYVYPFIVRNSGDPRISEGMNDTES